jgi:hypothetical protein
MSEKIVSVDYDPKFMRDMIINSFNLLISQGVDSVTVPVGTAGNRTISIRIEPEGEWSGKSIDIPMDGRNECINIDRDAVTLVTKQSSLPNDEDK